MSQIPREFIQQLLDRTDIVDFIDARIPLRKKTGSNFFACCPFHNEKSPSFSVSQTKQFFYCFGCGAHGNAIDFLMQHDHLNFPEAVEALARYAGMEVPRNHQHKEKPTPQPSLYDLLEKISQFYQQELRQKPEAITYLKKRGITGEIAKTFGIGYVPKSWDHVLQRFGKQAKEKQQLLETGMLIKKDDGGFYDRFRERIMFPIHDKRGRVIGFGGRILETGEPKYLNSPETPVFQKGHELYGLFHALRANRELTRVMIVEGYMDVIALFQHGITYAVATLGTATTAHHLQRLFRHTTEIIYCFDGDTAGKTAAWRALQVTLPLMKDGIQIRFMFLPDGEDPDSMVRKEGKDAFEKRMQQAISLSDFFFQTLAQQAELNTLDGRARFAKMASEQMEKLPDGFFKNMMQEELAKKSRVTVQPQTTIKKFSNKPTIKKTRPPSPLRAAIMLLVQHPELGKLITSPLPPLEMNGFALLNALLELTQQHSLTTGTLLEYWRDREEAQLLSKFAQMEHMIPEKGIKSEFLGAIQHLKKSANDQSIERLLAKAARETLSDEEKKHLNTLIHTKRTTTTPEHPL